MIENEEDIQDSEVDGCDSKEINSQAKAIYPGFFQHSTKDSVCSVYELAPASAGKLEAGPPLRRDFHRRKYWKASVCHFLIVGVA